jgi:hypothetical protein
MKLRTMLSVIVAVLSISGISGKAQAEEANTVYMDETYISGNQELPKVLYILPWKNQQGDAVPAMIPVLMNEAVMAPIYPHEYRLEMSYRALIADGMNATDQQARQHTQPQTQSNLENSISRSRSKED